MANAAQVTRSSQEITVITQNLRPTFNPDVVGRWDSDYSYPITGGVLRFQGHTNLFHEGTYNVSGLITLEGKAKDQGFKFSYDLVGAMPARLPSMFMGLGRFVA